MGDRTSVTIAIHKHYYDRLLKEEFAGDAKKLEEEANGDDIEFDDGDLVKFQCYEVNYASWDSLEDLLREHNIEFDKEWAAGGDYEAGESWARVVGGIYMEYELAEKDIAIKDHNDELLQYIDNPEKLKEIILKKDAEVNPFKVVPLSQPQSIDFIKNA